MSKLSSLVRIAACTAAILLATACAKEPSGAPEPPAEEPLPINEQMDGYLKSHYLWNEEYKTLKPDFSLDYSSFLEKTLLGMTTNTLDKKFDSMYGHDMLYSYIHLLWPIDGAAATSNTLGGNGRVSKKTIDGFGFASLLPLELPEPSTYEFGVKAVYPDSPAAKAGFKRGDRIRKVDGVAITDDNFNEIYMALTHSNENPTVTLIKADEESSPKTITKAVFDANPVLFSKVVEPTPQQRVGYLTYWAFDMAYYKEVLEVFQAFKAANVTDLIFDLRFNISGNILASQMISSCIAGATGSGKVFQYLRYNADRMANPALTSEQTGNPYDASQKMFYYPFVYGDFYGIDLRNYALNLPKIYVLTSPATASASESIVSSLEGIDIPVVVIGERTEGENVGTEYAFLTDAKDNYEFGPITFQCYNAKGETIDPSGIAPDYALTDKTALYDFCHPQEPLFAKAIELITGVAQKAAVANVRAVRGERLTRFRSLEAPRPLQGLIILPRDEQ